MSPDVLTKYVRIEISPLVNVIHMEYPRQLNGLHIEKYTVVPTYSHSGYSHTLLLSTLIEKPLTILHKIVNNSLCYSHAFIVTILDIVTLFQFPLLSKIPLL